MEVKDIIKDFQDYQAKLEKSEKTIKSYMTCINSFIKDYQMLKTNDLKQLQDLNFINRWIDAEKEKGLNLSTINKEKSILSVFSNYLVLIGLLDENKIKQFENLKTNNIHFDIYSNEQVDLILDLLSKKAKRKEKREVDNKLNIMYKCIFNIFFLLALRNEEVTRIQIDDINLNNGIMFVRCKGHKGEISHKSKLNNQVLNMVKEWLDIRRQIEVEEEYRDLLFVSPLTKKNISTDAIRKQMKKIKKELNINNDNLMVHTIRHTRLSNLISNGVDIQKISLYAHHSQVSTTNKYYIHITDNVLDELSNL